MGSGFDSQSHTLVSCLPCVPEWARSGPRPYEPFQSDTQLPFLGLANLVFPDITVILTIIFNGSTSFSMCNGY